MFITQPFDDASWCIISKLFVHWTVVNEEEMPRHCLFPNVTVGCFHSVQIHLQTEGCTPSLNANA